MANKTSLYLFSTLIVAMIILYTLISLSIMPNKTKNGFTRNMLPNIITESFLLPHLNIPITRICGATKEHFFLAGDNAQAILMVNNDLKKIDTLKINLPQTSEVRPPNTLIIDSPQVYLHSNNLSSIIYGNFSDSSIHRTKLNCPKFTRSAQISSERIIVRSFDSTYEKQFFKLANSKNGKIVAENEIIKNQGIAGFPSDGIMKYDKFSNSIIYMQFYQNRFYCLDTNLTIKYAGKTIDTTNSNSIEIKEVASGEEKRLMSSKPKILVNQTFSIDQEYIFVLSNLMADNEERKMFAENNVIDLYKIKTGAYYGSIYIPFLNGKKVKTFFSRENKLLAVYNNALAIYNLNLK